MKQLSLALISALLIIASACNKKDNTTVTPTVDSTRLYFHLHTNLDTNEVAAYNEVYEMESGRKISASIAQLYISNIQLVKEDGSLYSIPGAIIYKVQETEPYYLGMIPVGNYRSVRFHVGLDEATNALDAAANEALNHSEMWFGTAAQPGGYVYVNFAGKIDTTTNGDGTELQMQPFVYKLGTSTAYKEVDMPDHDPAFNAEKDVIQYVHMTIDYSKLFDGVQLNNSANLSITDAAANASAIGTTVQNNIPNMFSYEE